jgi:hypothetical protein
MDKKPTLDPAYSLAPDCLVRALASDLKAKRRQDVLVEAFKIIRDAYFEEYTDADEMDGRFAEVMDLLLDSLVVDLGVLDLEREQLETFFHKEK